MTRFNLSEWALRNQALLRYFIVVLAVLGVWSYLGLGQSEDPPFTFKVMVVQTQWPGATAAKITEQVTEKIEKKLQEIPAARLPAQLLATRRVAGVRRDQGLDCRRRACPTSSTRCARRSATSATRCRPASLGPFFNDEFGDTFGNIYALTGDGYSDAQLRDYAERLKLELLRVPDVAKVDLIGLQDEKIYIEVSNTKLATLGVSFDQVQQTLQAQNAITPAGSFETDSDRIYLRPSGAFDSVEAIRNISIRANGHLFRLGDIADVRRGYRRSAAAAHALQRQERARHRRVDARRRRHHRSSARISTRRSRACRRPCRSASNSSASPTSRARSRARSANSSTRSAIAVAIVLLVSFFSLGLRTGLVVALSIPLVLAMTFAAMKYFGIDLHKISLGALVLALGLLVDDAIIAVEMMAIKMEQGCDRVEAAAFAYTSTAFPMLTGTLVTAAGFLPIATAKSGTGEYTRSIFEVVAIALLISWLAAVVLIPYLGYKLLPERGRAHRAAFERRLRAVAQARLRRAPAGCAARRKQRARSQRRASTIPTQRRSTAASARWSTGASAIARP